LLFICLTEENELLGGFDEEAVRPAFSAFVDRKQRALLRSALRFGDALFGDQRVVGRGGRVDNENQWRLPVSRGPSPVVGKKRNVKSVASPRFQQPSSSPLHEIFRKIFFAPASTFPPSPRPSPGRSKRSTGQLGSSCGQLAALLAAAHHSWQGWHTHSFQATFQPL